MESVLGCNVCTPSWAEYCTVYEVVFMLSFVINDVLNSCCISEFICCLIIISLTGFPQGWGFSRVNLTKILCLISYYSQLVFFLFLLLNVIYEQYIIPSICLFMLEKSIMWLVYCYWLLVYC